MFVQTKTDLFMYLVISDDLIYLGEQTKMGGQSWDLQTREEARGRLIGV